MSKLINKAVYSIVKEEYKGHQISDAFLYLVKVVLLKKEYNRISVQELCKDFQECCGFSIPYHPMTVILSSLRKQGYICNGKMGAILPNMEKLREDVSIKPLETEQENLNRVIDLFIRFAASVDSNYRFSADDAERILDGFLDYNGLNLLNSTHSYSTVPEDPNIRLFFLFLNELGKTNPDQLEYIGSLVVGRILTELFISGQNESPGTSRSNATVYLDTPVVFSALGIDLFDRTEVYRNLVKDTQRLGMSVKVFYHTYTEMLALIEGSRPWLGNPNYDPVEATAATQYFVTHNYSSSDVTEYADDLEETLNKLGIQVDRMDYPSPTSIPRGVKTEQQYYEKIVAKYKESNPDFNEAEKKQTVDRDARTLFYVDYLNAGIRAPKMQDISRIFVTCNFSLASVSKDEVQYHREAIPDCVSDTYWGTLIWLNDPEQLLSSTKVRVAANANAAFSPSASLMRKLVTSVDKLQNEEIITPDEAFFLKSNPFAYTILMELTRGNDSYYTEKTPEEILQMIKQRAREEGELQERKKSEVLISEKDEEVIKLQAQFDQFAQESQAKYQQIETKLTHALEQNLELKADREEWRRQTILDAIHRQEECKEKADAKFFRVRVRMIILLVLAACAIGWGVYKLVHAGINDGVDYLDIVSISLGTLVGLTQIGALVFTGKRIDKNNMIAKHMWKKREKINASCGFNQMELENYKQELRVVEEKIASLKAQVSPAEEQRDSANEPTVSATG